MSSGFRPRIFWKPHFSTQNALFNHIMQKACFFATNKFAHICPFQGNAQPTSLPLSSGRYPEPVTTSTVFNVERKIALEDFRARRITGLTPNGRFAHRFEKDDRAAVRSYHDLSSASRRMGPTMKSFTEAYNWLQWIYLLTKILENFRRISPN